MFEQILSLLKDIIPKLLPLVGVWMGWVLNSHSQKKQRRLERLAESFNALREIRHVAEDIPPDLNEKELSDRLSSDVEFRKSLSSRLVRLFGLRTELIPTLDKEISELIDKYFQPLYRIKTGSYDLKVEQTSKFSSSCVKLRELVLQVEKRLTNEYEELKK